MLFSHFLKLLRRKKILERIELLDKIDEGIDDLESGRVHSHEDIKNEFSKWLK